MKIVPPPSEPTPSLAQLLCRGDVWQGREQRVAVQAGWDTGFAELNAALITQGWPLGQLVELCLPAPMQGEWLLLRHALLRTQGVLVLLNPPSLPFAQGLIQLGFDLDRVFIVQAAKRADFLASFVELTRARDCTALLAWQPQPALSYTDLRKCLLASQQGRGFYVLCRPQSVHNQSSPASLRLQVQLAARHLSVTVFKQKGSLKPSSQPILLPLPEQWLGVLPHAQLDQSGRKPGTALTPQANSAWRI